MTHTKVACFSLKHHLPDSTHQV